MIAAVIQPYHTMQGYSMEPKESDKIHQMLQGLENSPGNLQQLNLDGSPDMEIDGRKNPVGGQVIILMARRRSKRPLHRFTTTTRAMFSGSVPTLGRVVQPGCNSVESTCTTETRQRN